MIVRQSSGDFSRERGRVRGSHYRYFLTISQQKPGKRNFGDFLFLGLATEAGLRRAGKNGTDRTEGTEVRREAGGEISDFKRRERSGAVLPSLRDNSRQSECVLAQNRMNEKTR